MPHFGIEQGIPRAPHPLATLTDTEPHGMQPVFGPFRRDFHVPGYVSRPDSIRVWMKD